MDKAFYISFNTLDMPGKIKAIRVRLDTEIVSDMNKSFPINLSDHPLYPDLERYVLNNPSRRKADEKEI